MSRRASRGETESARTSAIGSVSDGVLLYDYVAWEQLSKQRRGIMWALQTARSMKRALVLPSPLNMTVAFVNDVHHFARGKVAPTHVRYRWVTDLVLPALPTLFRDGERRLVVALNDGMVENVQGNDDARAASAASIRGCRGTAGCSHW